VAHYVLFRLEQISRHLVRLADNMQVFDNAKNTRGRNAKSNLTNKKRKERRKIKQKKQSHKQVEANQKHIKNLSNKGLSND